MIKLISNELKKIFHKKSIYITLGIFIAILALLNIVSSRIDFSDIEDYQFGEENVQYLTSSLNDYNPDNYEEVDSYISTKTEIDYITFVNNYDNSSWQRKIAMEKAHEIIYNINRAKYNSKDNDLLATYEAELENLKLKLANDDDWRIFVSEEKAVNESKINDIKKELTNNLDKSSKENLEKELKTSEIHLYVLKYRLDNDVSYDNSYLDTALIEYESNNITLLEINKENMSKEEEAQYNDLKKSITTQEYILENKADISTSSYSARNIFMSFIGDNYIFFIILTVMIAGGIVAEEFSKGTIKMLLIRPYQRWKILLSKYITCFLILLFTIGVLLLAQYIIGGFAFGFESYSVPAIVYNYGSKSMVEVSLMKHILLNLVAILPMLILLLTLAFTISTVFTSSSLAITLTLLTTFFSSVVNMMIIRSKIKILSLFPTMVWDLTEFLYGGTPSYEYMKLNNCIIMSIVYLLIMIFISFFVFKHKNVKNI